MKHPLLSGKLGTRLPIATLMMVLLAVAMHFVTGAAEWLQYDRVALARGEFWRLVTCHFAHWSGDHLFWDVLAFGALGWLCERDGKQSFLACVGLAALLIPLTVWVALPQMATYRGLSGIDSALFALLAARAVCRAAGDKDWSAFAVVTLVSGGFAAKIGFELCTGSTLFVDSATAGLTPVPLAHVIGTLVGVVCAVRDAQPQTLTLHSRSRPIDSAV